MVLAKISSGLQRSRVPFSSKFFFSVSAVNICSNSLEQKGTQFMNLGLSMLICNYATLVLRSYYVIGYVLISNKASPLWQRWCKWKRNHALHNFALLNAGHYGLLAGGASFHGHCYGASWLLELLIAIFWNDVSPKKKLAQRGSSAWTCPSRV